MLWAMIAVTLGFFGIAVLGVLAVRVGLEVRRLAREVSAAERAVTAAAESLERAATPLVTRR
ncbi:hypothetical protein [Streptomyces boninensis]|uniref:hypothetical protein n=1 Tax=Streptomyces boninensis TaxID=2039455 RepID=UPI003B21D18E